MGRQIAWDEVPEAGSVVPDGCYHLQIEMLEEKQSSTGKLMYAGQFSVVEPAEFAGSMVFENYTIGSDEDPDAADPLTWKKSVAARLLKTMLTKAQVPLGDDMDETCLAAQGMQFLGLLGTESQEGYRPKNTLQSCYTVGERTVGVTDGRATQSRRAPTPAPARPAPAPIRPVAPAPRGAVGTPRQPLQPAPGAPRAAAPAPRPAPAVQPPKVQTLTCTICREKVARAEFADHVESCQGAAT